MSQLSLCIDSSLKGVALALVASSPESGQVLARRSEHSRYGSAGLLSQALQEVLAETQLSLADLHRVVVAVGPGSFTGIKVGLAWCFGLAAPYRQNLAWLGVSALEEAAAALLAEQSQAQAQEKLPEAVSLFLPSTASHGYLAHFCPGQRLRGSCLWALGETNTAFGPTVELLGRSRVYIAGPWPAAQAWLEQLGQKAALLSYQELMDYALEGMISRALKSPNAAFSQELPQPRYLRKSTAEEKLEQSKRLSL